MSSDYGGARSLPLRKFAAALPRQHAVSSPQARRASRMSKSELTGRWPDPPARYAVAVLSVVLAIVGAEIFTPLLNAEAIASAMLCAVIFTAFVGGFGPALLAVALTLLAFHYYLAPPANSFAWKDHLFTIGVSEVPRLALFSLISLVVASVISTQRRTAREMQVSRDEL